MEQDDVFLPIPGLGHADAAVVQSLLAAAGFDYHVHAVLENARRSS